MHVFVAGATGALGRPLVRLLIEQGHLVTGLTQSRPDVVEQLGARPAVGNALDADVLTKLVAEAAPDAVVHALTRIPQSINITPANMRLNDLTRIKGTLNLIEACKGVNKLVAGSVTFAFRGRSENKMQPLGNMGPLQPTIEAVESLERQVLEASGSVLRFGYFYGPGTSISEQWPAALKAKTFPIVGKGTAWWSFIHVDDAATGVAAALNAAESGEVYNIVDDEPLLAGEALDFIAASVQAKPPRRLLPVGSARVKHFFNGGTGASNSKARSAFHWTPRYPSLKEGFESG